MNQYSPPTSFLTNHSTNCIISTLYFLSCLHELRHSYATHLMEEGVNVFYIQKILGHATLWTTMRYLRIAMTDVMKTKSPLDTLMEKEEKRKSKGGR